MLTAPNDSTVQCGGFFCVFFLIIHNEFCAMSGYFDFAIFYALFYGICDKFDWNGK